MEKDKPFCWEEIHGQSFIKIKEKFRENLELRIPDLQKEFTLETDASNMGIGAVLLQEKLPIVYISRNLTKTEAGYGITEKEVLAALWAMEKLKFYLSGRRFKLVSDHKAIMEIKTKAEFGSVRIQRWFKRFERFDFYIENRKGEDMVQADALSRGVLDARNDIEEKTDASVLKYMNSLTTEKIFVMN